MEMKQYTQQKETGDETKNKARYDVAVIGGGPPDMWRPSGQLSWEPG